MRVSVLVVVCHGKENISLHASDPHAWFALVNLVDKHCANASEQGDAVPPSSEEERVGLFFSDSGRSYIIGSADVSEVDAHIKAALETKESTSSADTG